MLCIYERVNDERIRCARCGHERAWNLADRLPFRECGGVRGLGDVVHRAISAVVRPAAQAIGLDWSTCEPCEDRRAALNELFPLGRPLGPGERTWSFPHGLGDAAQFTAIASWLARERPEIRITLAVKPGIASLFDGHCNIECVPIATTRWPAVRWAEAGAAFHRMPATKIEQSLRDDWESESTATPLIQPSAADTHAIAEWLDSLPRGKKVLVHYQGNSNSWAKNLDEHTVGWLARVANDMGWHLVIVDFEEPPRSAAVRSGIALRFPATALARTNDEARVSGLAALAQRCDALIAVDSGPGHIWEGTPNAAPMLRLWPGLLHPVHYASPAEHVAHLVGVHHSESIRSPRDNGLAAFYWLYQQVEMKSFYASAIRPYIQTFLQDPPRFVDSLKRPSIWRRLEWRPGDAAIVIEALRDEYALAAWPHMPQRVLDVGAHIGTFAMSCHARWPTAHVACCEPEPTNIALLLKNAWFAVSVPVAIGYGDGLSWWDGSAIGTADSVLAKTPPSAAHRAGPTVLVRTVENVLDYLGWDSVDLLKLDIEGGEFDVLESCDVGRIRGIIGEYHASRDQGGWPRLSSIIARRWPHHRLERISEKPNGDGIFWLTPGCSHRSV